MGKDADSLSARFILILIMQNCGTTGVECERADGPSALLFETKKDGADFFTPSLLSDSSSKITFSS